MKKLRTRSRSNRTGFTIIELLVVMSVIAVLVALLVPAIQESRESARALQCKSHLREFGHAIHNFESAFRSLPAGSDYTNEYGHSWCTRILPFLDQTPLYNEYNWTKVWNDPTSSATSSSNQQVISVNLPIFQCPSEPLDRLGGIDYGGNFGTSLTGLPIGFNTSDGWESGALLVINADLTKSPQTVPAKFDSFSDGLSQTIMAYECSGRTGEAGQWGSGANCMAFEEPINGSASGETIISRHTGGGHLLFADGHVVFVSNSTDMNLVAKMATRNRGEVVSSSF